ncbi:MAG TPA: monofunctional biosynthetic peptidoglycan transglycosylase [Gammaproteobacteria bacterium]|nr:monofunctional biosynthetic peptidoglycan transglycosylase [Gammaproteobacteria bacterium]
MSLGKFFGARRWLRAVGLLLVAWLAVSFGAVALLRWHAPPFTAVMLEQPGPFARIDYRWVDRKAISRSAARAAIAAEDQRFLEHHGIDFVSIDRALDEYRAGDGLRGASTITQQVAKNLFLWQGRSFVRKALEAYFALVIELLWPKQRILEMYLNIAELGPGVFGVEAAARRFFDVPASRLTAPQAALLAAVLPNPRRFSAARPSAYVRSRQGFILTQMRLLEVRGHYEGLEW